MHCQRYTDAIQEMVDGRLTPIRRSELEAHLTQCEDCRHLLEDLERIRDLAAKLDRPVVPNRVWMQVAGRLRQEGRIRPAVVVVKPAHRRYALVAIAATLLIAVGASLFVLLPAARGSRQQLATARPPAGNSAAGAAVQADKGDIAEEFRLAEEHYRNAIAKLEEAAKSDQNAIDPQTAVTIQKSMSVIDQAIAESSAAFRSEPTSMAARDSLFDALKRKVSLLQDTIALMNEMRKGNAVGAARVVEGVNKG
jgi:anti-sigma factor RsiW